MPKDEQLLLNVTAQVHNVAARRKELEIEAAEWVTRSLEPEFKALAQAIFVAREEGYPVIDIARAYTTPGKTPNRNAVYAIINQFKKQTVEEDLPFKWVPRTVKTASGKKTVFDVHAEFSEYGPEDLTGDFTWRYDESTSTLDPVLKVDEDPYPVDSSFYRSLLGRWVQANPYPTKED